MRYCLLSSLLCSLVLLVGLSLATAQQVSPEQAAFEAAFAEVKASYRDIETLQTEYQTADPARQQAIQQELKTIASTTQPKVDKMVDEALKAFKAAPMADPQVADLLVSVVEHQMVGRGVGGGGDQYEAALPVLEALIEGGHKKPELPVWGVLAAVVTNHFDLADQFAEIAEKTGAFATDPGQSKEAKETFGIAQKFYQMRDQYRQMWAQESAIRNAEAAADDLPRVKFTTSKGDIVIELFENEAPIAVANFISLVKKGFYDGVVFHRVLARFMVQGGDPKGTGTGGPGYTIACECDKPDARKHFRGTLSMAHAGRDTGGSQFFLTLVPTDHLDGVHTVFGRVLEGFEVLSDLQKVNPGEPGPAPDQILKAEVLRDRGHGYEFKKGPGR